MDSIIQKDKECFFCGTTLNLHKHHIFGAANRPISEKYGCVCYLCADHHNMSGESVHMNRGMDLALKGLAQHEMEKTMSREAFIKLFGRSWL